MSPTVSPYEAEAARDFARARDARGLATAVVVLHRRIDEVMAASVQGHGVTVACASGCAHCCHLLVEVMPAEAFHLAEWLRRTLAPARIAQILERLRHNVTATRAMGGTAARKQANVPCALLGEDKRCIAYAVRPAACRRCHSTRLETCEQTYARPGDDSIESPMHPAVAHNAAVIAAQARQAQAAHGLDATPQDLDSALLAALGDGKAWRRWRDGKKAFV